MGNSLFVLFTDRALLKQSSGFTITILQYYISRGSPFNFHAIPHDLGYPSCLEYTAQMDRYLFSVSLVAFVLYTRRVYTQEGMWVIRSLSAQLIIILQFYNAIWFLRGQNRGQANSAYAYQ